MQNVADVMLSCIDVRPRDGDDGGKREGIYDVELFLQMRKVMLRGPIEGEVIRDDG